jgi:hypothetical protein
MLDLQDTPAPSGKSLRQGGKSWPQTAVRRRQIAAAPAGDTLSMMKELL